MGSASDEMPKLRAETKEKVLNTQILVVPSSKNYEVHYANGVKGLAASSMTSRGLKHLYHPLAGKSGL